MYLLILETEGEREKQQCEGKIDWLPPVCAWTRDQTLNLSVYGRTLQLTEPLGQGYIYFFKARIQMLEIVIIHFISITKDFGGFLIKIPETCKTSKHYYVNLSNLFLNVQDYAGK